MSPQAFELFKIIIKYCEACGKPLILHCNQDIQRKRFCSRRCHYIVIHPNTYVPLPSAESRQKMRESKLMLIAKGWQPIGWKKYKTQKRLSKRGYIFIGRKREHQLLIENLIGRPLDSQEVVHHRNGDKSDSSLNNLCLMTRSEHIKYHMAIRKQYA